MVNPTARRRARHVEDESSLQRDFIAKVRERGAMAYKLACTARRGFPDVVVIRRGRVTFVELKTERGKMSALQEFCHRELQQAGAEVVTVYGRQCAFELLDIIFRKRSK